jgi:hypothetical protein
VGYFICRLYDGVGQNRAEQSRAGMVCRESFFAEGGCCHSRIGKWRGGDNVGAKEGQDMSSEALVFFFLLSPLVSHCFPSCLSTQ